MYADALVEEGVLTREEVMKVTADHTTYLAEQFKLLDSYVPKVGKYTVLRNSLLVRQNPSYIGQLSCV